MRDFDRRYRELLRAARRAPGRPIPEPDFSRLLPAPGATMARVPRLAPLSFRPRFALVAATVILYLVAAPFWGDAFTAAASLRVTLADVPRPPALPSPPVPPPPAIPRPPSLPAPQAFWQSIVAEVSP